MEEIRQAYLTGERALFRQKDTAIYDTIFDDGESPLKHSENIELYNCMFKWKYPLWYSKNIRLRGGSIFEMGRAGIWYTENIDVSGTVIQAPKNFRRCRGVRLSDVHFPNAAETLWSCRDVEMEQVDARGDYFAMNCEDLDVRGLTLVGNYSFDGVKNAVIRDSRLLSKDAFWNSENVTVCNSFLSGEYLGWNSKNITLINCTVESLQGMCFIDGLVMKNCKLINTTLAFEYSSVEADICSRIDSVINPTCGTILSDGIGELILEKDKIDPTRTKILYRNADPEAERKAEAE